MTQGAGGVAGGTGGAAGAGGGSTNSKTLAAMKSAADQMAQVLQETTTFNAVKQDIGAGTTAAQSVGQQTPGG